MANVLPLKIKPAIPVSLTPALSQKERGTESRCASFTLKTCIRRPLGPQRFMAAGLGAVGCRHTRNRVVRQRFRTLHTQVGSDPGCVAIFTPARAVALRAVMYDR